MNTFSLTIIDIVVFSAILWLFFVSGAAFWAVLRSRATHVRYVYLPDPWEVAKQPRTGTRMTIEDDGDNVIFLNNTDEEID